VSPPPAAIAAVRAEAPADPRSPAIGRTSLGEQGRSRDAVALSGAIARAWLRPARDAAIAAGALALAIVAGSGGLAHVDPALVGYLAATFVAFVLAVHRASAFWRRPASALYARALVDALRSPRTLRATLAHATRDLAAQDFIRRRSLLRWSAHLLLSLGTLASFAITVPLVFGWMRFAAEGDRYRIVLFTVPTIPIAVDGVPAWLVFHGLSLAGVAVALGATAFLALRMRLRRLPGATSGFALAPLVLLLIVALTGLALPASRGIPGMFQWASVLHEIAVIVLLIAIPFSKLGHVLIRPLQLGARAVRAAGESRMRCACGAVLAPARQQAAVARLLADRGFRFEAHPDLCPSCRRRQLASAQAGLVDAYFQPRLTCARPAARPPGEGS
jgi:hypothetical protein